MSVTHRTSAGLLCVLAAALPACSPTPAPVQGEWVLDAAATLAQTTRAPRREAARDAVTSMRLRYHFEVDGTVGVSFRHGTQHWARTGLWRLADGEQAYRRSGLFRAMAWWQQRSNGTSVATRYQILPGYDDAGWSAYTVTVRDGALEVPAPHEDGALVVLSQRAVGD